MPISRFSIMTIALVLSFSSLVFAGEDEKLVNLQQAGQHGDHYNIPMPADMPDVYHNSAAQTLIIDGMGVVSCYDVEIMSATSFVVYIATTVNGTYDTIDISSLPAGDYIITIDSPWGNTYEGTFDTY